MSGVIYLEKKISDGFARAMSEDEFSIEYSGAYSRFNEIFNSSKFIVVAGEYSNDGLTVLITAGASMLMEGDSFQIIINVIERVIFALVTKGNPDIIRFTKLDQ